MGIEPIVFEQGQDATPPLTELKRTLLRQAEENFDLGFESHPARRQKILFAFRRLMSLENMRSALFPGRPLGKADVAPLTPKIKEKEIGSDRLKTFGVISSFHPDIYLYASIYVLPAPPDFARRASAHAGEYAKIRPYVFRSLTCHLPNGDPAFYLEAGAFGFSASMVVTVQGRGPVGHYHLAPFCRNGASGPLETDDVSAMDGMKIYWPVRIKNGERVYDYTFVLSSTISIWEGLKGWVKDRMSDESHATIYGLGGAAEILSVLKRLP